MTWVVIKKHISGGPYATAAYPADEGTVASTAGKIKFQPGGELAAARRCKLDPGG